MLRRIPHTPCSLRGSESCFARCFCLTAGFGSSPDPCSVGSELAFASQKGGGEGGIRTHGTRWGTTVFETARFNHSRTSPSLSWGVLRHTPQTPRSLRGSEFRLARRCGLSASKNSPLS